MNLCGRCEAPCIRDGFPGGGFLEPVTVQPVAVQESSSAGAALYGPPAGVGKGTREKKVSDGL